jgi:hypothetical protein
VPFEMRERAFLRCGQGAGEAGGLPAENPVEPAARMVRSMLRAICSTAKPSSWARKLGSSDVTISTTSSPSPLDCLTRWTGRT